MNDSQTTRPLIQPGRYTGFCLFLIFACLLADQYTKWLVMETALRVQAETPDFWTWFFKRELLPYFYIDRPEFRVIEHASWLNFVMVWNQGVSFGLFDTNKPGAYVAFAAISLIISMMLLVWLALNRSLFVSLSLSLVIGGALGNVIDRFRFGAVADFIDLHVAGYHWPAFNLADSYIVLGASMLVAESFMGDGKGMKI